MEAEFGSKFSHLLSIDLKAGSQGHLKFLIKGSNFEDKHSRVWEWPV